MVARIGLLAMLAAVGCGDSVAGARKEVERTIDDSLARTH